MKKLVILGLGLALLGAGFVGAKANEKSFEQHKDKENFISLKELSLNNQMLAKFLGHKTAEIFNLKNQNVAVVMNHRILILQPSEFNNVKKIEAFNYKKQNFSIPLMGIPKKISVDNFFVYCGWKKSVEKRKSNTGFIVATPFPVAKAAKDRKSVTFFVEDQTKAA